MHRILQTGTCLLLAAAVVACSPQTTSTPTPTPTSTSSSASDSAVPKVASPKKLTGVPACQLLTTQQLQTLGAATNPKTGKSPWGEGSCEWNTAEVAIHLSPDTTTGKGLAQTYSSKSKFDSFQPTTVAGYPSVQVDKQDISCGLFVGVSDTQVLSLTVFIDGKGNPDYHNPCAFAPKVATAVLANLPAGQ